MFLLEGEVTGATTGVGSSSGFCAGTATIWQLVGRILTIFKIVIPILILIFGMIDLGKAVIASKDDEIKKAAKSLLMRVIAGLVIFFIPTLIGFVFTIVDAFNEVNNDYQTCATCITHPWGTSCDTAVQNQKY